MSRVSAFIQSPDKHGAVDVYADGVYVMTLSEDTVIGAGLKIGAELDEAALEAVERARLRTKAYNKAYDLLSYGDMSEKTMRTKLARYDFDDALVDEVVCKLTEQGYLDDTRYATALARYLADSKCYGPRRISQELYLKGVDRSTADLAIDALDTDFYETVRTHIPRGFDFSDRKAVSRLYGQLVRRGFDYDMINSVIKEPEDF